MVNVFIGLSDLLKWIIMKNLLAILLFIWFSCQNSIAYSQVNCCNKLKVESYFNMDTTLGVIFCGKLNHLLYNSALEDRISVYKTSNLKPEEKLDKDQILMLYTEGEHLQIVDPNDPNCEALIDTFIVNPFRIEDATGFYFSINWQLHPSGYSYSGTIDAFSMSYYSSDSMKMLPLFWVQFNDLKKILKPNEFHQLQEALFLHIYTHYDYSDSTRYHKNLETTDIKTNSTLKQYYNYRTQSDVNPKEWSLMNKKLYYDATHEIVTVYKDESLDKAGIITAEDILSGGSSFTSLPDNYNYSVDDTNVFFVVDTLFDVVNIDSIKRIDTFFYRIFNRFDIDGNSVSEKWDMDYIQNKIIGKITGLSIDYEIIIEGNSLGRYPAFFFPYKYIEKIIGKSELFRLSNILFNSLIKYYLNNFIPIRFLKQSQ